MSNPTGSGTPQRNRRKFSSHSLHQKFRLRLVLDDMLFALVASLAAIAILYFLSNREIGDNLYSAHFSIKETKELLTNGARIAGVVTFVAVMLFGFWSMIDAHRIAGPMHRLNRLLREVAQGDLTHEIKFRKGDEFQEVAEAADLLVDTYEVRIRDIQTRAAGLTQLAERAAADPSAQAELRDSIYQLNADLAFFRVPANGAAPEVDGTPIAQEKSK